MPSVKGQEPRVKFFKCQMCQVARAKRQEVSTIQSQVYQVSNVSSDKGHVSKSVKFQVPSVKMCHEMSSFKCPGSIVKFIKCQVSRSV